jgi:hypothetical protein
MTKARLYNNVNVNGYNSLELLLAQLHKSFQPKYLNAIERQFLDMAETEVWLLEVFRVCFKETPPMAEICVLILLPYETRMNSGTSESSKLTFCIMAKGTWNVLRDSAKDYHSSVIMLEIGTHNIE